MKIKISVYQLFAANIMVPLGTAMLFLINPEAKQDAWIGMLIYIVPAIILQLVYISLWQKYPEDTIVTYMPQIFGKIIGYVLSILYIIFFVYEAARSVRDFTELILTSIIPKASYFIVLLSIMAIIWYLAFSGLENMFRSINMFLYMGMIFLILEWIFLFTTEGTVNLDNIKPILSDGILPVIKESWKLITFPYGETIVIAMFLPCVKETAKVRKMSILSMIFLGILLSVNAIMFLSVLGVELSSNTPFPFLRTIKMMKIGETFDRVDIFFILIMMIGGAIKVSFFMYASMLGTCQLIKIKDTKYLALPFSILIYFASILIAKNYPQHIYIGQTLSLKYIHLPFEVIIPIIALIIYYIKRYICSIFHFK
ncbi:MAG: GerAB/ArcD/ProY family transporter [Clostridium sp.]|nr:GerAB/ArcD/ProY family transporter [Clostridium sp.]